MNKAYIIEKGQTILFESTEPHCDSCLEDIREGYTDIEACCCIHKNEYKINQGYNFKQSQSFGPVDLHGFTTTLERSDIPNN